MYAAVKDVACATTHDQRVGHDIRIHEDVMVHQSHASHCCQLPHFIDGFRVQGFVKQRVIFQDLV